MGTGVAVCPEVQEMAVVCRYSPASLILSPLVRKSRVGKRRELWRYQNKREADQGVRGPVGYRAKEAGYRKEAAG